MTARRVRVAKLERDMVEALLQNRHPRRRQDLIRMSDEDLYALLPAWFKATSDDDLEELCLLMRRRPLEGHDQARWLDIERACVARLAAEQSGAGIATLEASSGQRPQA